MADPLIVGGKDPIAYRFKIFKKIGYVPHEKQEMFHRSTARFRIFAGAARSGKSWCSGNEALVRALYPVKQMIWIVGPTYAIADKIFRDVWDKLHTFWPSLIDKGSSYHAKKIVLKITGTVIEGKSTDNPISLLGETVDFVVVDEASRIKAEVYNRYLKTRLITSGGDMIMSSTPRGKGTFFHEYFLLGMKKDPKYFSTHCTIYENPGVDMDAVRDEELTTKITDPDGFKQEYLGQFVDFCGDVFPSYDPTFFMPTRPFEGVNEFDACVDPGTRNPFAMLIIQRKRPYVRVIEEYYKPGMSTWENALRIRPILEKYGVKKCVVDPREPDAIDILNRLIPKTRFFAPPASDISLGLNVIRDHLLRRNGIPLLQMDEKCINLKMEFEKAHYKDNNKEEPVDKDNHLLSALRYYMVRYCNYLRRAANNRPAAFGSDRLITKLLNDKHSSLVKNDFDLESRPWMGGYSE